MYLKSLELQGFKSFPDKTVIEFDPGMTAIVGANGSGKSNISDAVRWVLGEMSAKSLRGSKMEDVIFNGSAKRRPASFAEVVMTIDNSDFLMKIDYDEVSVGRRLYRTGESEYSINHKQVRLKDVVDLFLNTGIGREGYSVISQGKIAEIISLKGNERRELFEEAAGISRYRYRKNEATQKLASVNDNALRIGDILAEVEGRLPRLRAQSAKAKEYLAVADKKKELELALWSARIASIVEILTRGREDASRAQKEIDDLSGVIEGQDRTLDDLYIQTQKNTMHSEALRSEVTDLAARDTELASSLSVLENEIHHMDQKKVEIEAQSEKESDYQKELEQEKEKILLRQAEIRAEADTVEDEFEQNRARQASLAETYLAVVEAEETLLQEKEGLSRQKNDLELEKKEGAGYGEAARARKAGLVGRLQTQEREDPAAAARLKELEKAAKEGEARRIEEEKKNGRINLDLYHLGEEIEEKNAVLQKARLEKMDTEQRRDTLMRMERLLEGFSDSVKEIMNAAATELNGVCGPISRLISTDEDYVLAIETALGGGVQHIVVESEQNAKEAISFLKENRLGRATFLPLDSLRIALYDIRAIHENGFLGRASDLCRCEEKYRPALEFMLGKTLVCRDIASASRLAKEEKYGVKIVTLDGQVIHAGGSYTGGQALRLTGVLSRSGDLAALKDAIEKAAVRIDSLGKGVGALEEQRAASRRLLKESDESLSALRIEELKAKNAFTLEQERCAEKSADAERIRTEIASIEESVREKERRAAEITVLLGTFREREEELDRAITAKRQEKEAKEKERERLIVEAGEILARRGQTKLLLEQVDTSLAENRAALDRITQGDRDQAAALSELAHKREETLIFIEETKAKRTAIAQEMEEKRAALSKLTEEVKRIGEESAAIRLAQKANQTKKETLIQEHSRLTSRLAGISRERDGILRSLAEEYEMDADSEEFQNAKNTDTAALGGEKRLQELRGAIRRIGPVSLDSIHELEEAEERYQFLSAQYSDITKSKEELEKLIGDLERTMREMFSETFEQIRYAFRQIFSELFGGGSADIELTNREDLLNCGVEIRVQPPGKVIKSLSLLSGGEQAFVAIALYMALLRINPSPFCIFDEIESALDEANVRRFADYIKKHNDQTQFIVITHRRGTMESADILYGITMQEKGVSDFIRLDAADSARYATEEKEN